jgi:DNA-binding NarL/FixJ family response regulator
MKKIKILITDDHSIVREGIKALLSGIEDFLIVGEAENGKESIEQIRVLSPDIVIMDISMPVMSGIEAIKIIKNDFPQVGTLVLTIHHEEEYVEQIFKSGANGCVYKSAGKTEFELAIRTIIKGENYFCSGLSNVLMQGYFNKKENQKLTSKNENLLTKRELEIIKLIAEEYTNQEMAGKLFISVRTVETHRNNMMKKLNINSTLALIKYALHEGIISVD